MKNTLYCEINFLNNFFENRPKENDTTVEDASVDIWRKYNSMFQKNANILLDVSKEEFDKQQGVFFNMMRKRISTSEIKIKFNKFPINYDDVNKHAIFFLADDDKCIQLEEEQGMLFLSNKNLSEKAKFLLSGGEFFKIDNKNSWQNLEVYHHPCNFIFLIDNFLFKKKSDVESELKSIFDALLPDKLKKEFKLTIFTKNPDKIAKDPDKNDWKNMTVFELETAIEDIIKNVRRSINVKVTIEFREYSQHDRHLITNYCWFSCGYGFVMDYNEKSKGSDVHIHNITAPNVYDRITEIIEQKNN